MFVIFGTQTKRNILGFRNANYQCYHCGQNIRGKIIHTEEYFDIFWIPLFKYSNEYYEICPMCENNLRQLNQQEAYNLINN